MTLLPDPRVHFFNEAGDMLPPFRRPGWRGGLLARDVLDCARLPRPLFEAIVQVAGSDALVVAGDVPQGVASQTIAADWAAYRAVVCARDVAFLEFVVYDASRRWALLADVDATVLGLDAALADRLDAALAAAGTSLATLSGDAYGDLAAATPRFAAYFDAVIGG